MWWHLRREANDHDRTAAALVQIMQDDMYEGMIFMMLTATAIANRFTPRVRSISVFWVCCVLVGESTLNNGSGDSDFLKCFNCSPATTNITFLFTLPTLPFTTQCAMKPATVGHRQLLNCHDIHISTTLPLQNRQLQTHA